MNTLAQIPDSQTLRSLGSRLLRDDLIVFPVRHHSPACAFHLSRLIRERKPSLVLVEGPRSFDPMISLLTDESARMPLAIYTYVVGRASGDESPTRHAAYYPFCDYSPELVALRLARALSIPARFIDLDFAELCQVEVQHNEEEARSLLNERHLERSAHLRLLAGRLGCRDHEELWEHLFECQAPSHELSDHVANVAAYCQLARYDWSEDELRRDATLARELEMAWHIREGLKARDRTSGPVLAVVGGFHAVVLPDLVEQGGERPQIVRSLSAEESSSLIRYSFDRLDRLNGYGAGMTSPAWHQRLWERLLKLERVQGGLGPKMRQGAALDALFDIAGVLREDHQVSVAMPTLAAAYQHALSLAKLRRRLAPVREDVVDSVTSCFVKGDIQAEGPVIYGAVRKVMTGAATGRVPAGAPKPPLLRDFEYCARRQRLKIDDAEPRRSQLDIYRRPEHRVTSRLLHGLTFLGIPFAARTAGPDFVHGVALNRLQEHWEYCYFAASEAAIVEASIYGVTVPLAVADRFRSHLDALVAGDEAGNARAAVALFAQGCTLGLHDHLPRVLAALRSAIAQDPNFQSVALATSSLGLLWESREPLEARDVSELMDVLRAAFERAVYLGSSVGVGSDKDSATEVMHALTRLREVVLSAAGAQLDGSLYWEMIERVAAEHDEPIIRGTTVGLLYSAGRIAPSELATLLTGQFLGAREPQRSVGFLRGLLHASRETAWQLPVLMEALDTLLASWDEKTFIEALPQMRLAFSEMTPRETDRVGETVAGLHGEKHLGSLVNYDVGEAQLVANLNLSQTLLAVLEADGLGSWIRS